MEGNRRTSEFMLKLFLGLVLVAFILLYKFAYLNLSQSTDLIWQESSKLFAYKDHNSNTLLDFRYENITQPPSGYLVWNENCHMQNVEPFTPEVMSFYKPIEPMNCSSGEKFIIKLFDNEWKMYRLHMNVHLKGQYVKVDDEISCCYMEILRTGSGSAADENYKLLPCVHFLQDFEVPAHIDGMIVQCKSVAHNELVYQDAHFFIQERKEVRARLMNHTNKLQNADPFGVLLIGIDSLSQINFRRTMPKTFDHLKQNNWFELSGYNKMGDNTFPNLMALLTGLNLTRAHEVCKPTQVGGLNNCSMLFNLFRLNGFATAYSEDEYWMSSFNYLKRGFQQPPTDYYLRPFTIAISKNLPVKKQSGMTFCIGLHRAAEYIYDFGIEFAHRFSGQRTFGLFWTNSFSHNSYDDPSGMDLRMTDYLRELRLRGILDHSVVILFSDHGSRWGRIRNMAQGFLEERLPMFFIWLPDWMRQKYPEYVHALRVNQHRLTSPYDIYMTLKHLLTLSNGGQSADMVGDFGPAEGCAKCQTVLQPVPENRSCQDVGIDEHWCTCQAYDAVSIYSKDMQNITHLVIDEMNFFLQNQTFAELCSNLTLKDLREANEKVNLDVKDHPKSNETFYRIRFDAAPKDAEFEATFTYNKSSHSVEIDVTSISRLNTYASDSACIDDKISKKYCICK